MITKKIPKNLKEEILAGKLFIYPTDTIYGIGCDATNEKSVEKIKEIKGRDRNKPLSIIAPDIKWILDNFITTQEEIKRYLPGPYTLLLKKKEPSFLNWISSNDRVGIRIPANRFTKEIQKSGLPFVTTSVNISGETFVLKIEDIKQGILDKIDFIIDSDEVLSGKPSTLVIDGKELERK
jgi:L-threonylcarbamoyladenylate synthase